MRKEKYVIALDVGGTSLKTAIVSSKGYIFRKTFKIIPIDSRGSAESIIGTFVKALNFSLEIIREPNLDLRGVAISTCGPFDMEKGISLMKHKYASIYGINLKDELRKRLKLKKDLLIVFDGDSWSFLRGEAWRGAAKGYNRIVGITIGAGLGSVFMVNNEIVLKGPGVPPNGGLWCLPYDDGVLDDRISGRGIIKRYSEMGGEYREGMDVKDIALKGLKEKDEVSLKVFQETGLILGEVLEPILLEFKPECLVFGGQISKSFSLLSKPIRKKLRSVESLRKISRAHHIDLSSIYGVAKLLFEKTVTQ